MLSRKRGTMKHSSLFFASILFSVSVSGCSSYREFEAYKKMGWGLNASKFMLTSKLDKFTVLDTVFKPDCRHKR